MSDGDGFTFTPFFNKFKNTDDIDKYLEKYIEDKKVEKLDVRFDHLTRCSYYINPETLELEDFIEGDTNYESYYVWNNKTKKLDEVDSNSLSDEDEDEDEDVDWEVQEVCNSFKQSFDTRTPLYVGYVWFTRWGTPRVVGRPLSI